MGMDKDMLGSWRSVKPEWRGLVWILKVWGAAALAVLLLEMLGIHPPGVLLRLWSSIS
jgi:hypothetical protein